MPSSRTSGRTVSCSGAGWMDREVPEPPGLRRPKASHPPAGRPEPRAAPPALPFAGAGGERPALRDGSLAPGRLQ